MAASPPQIGLLVPLNNNLEEDTSLPQLPIFQGSNIVGRNCIPVSDKRLSRKHLTITTSSDGSADVIVEGSNPVVVRSQDQRKKILSRERVKIKHGDIIELIPGHHLFKFVTLAAEKNSSSPSKKRRMNPKEGSEVRKGDVQSVKRKRQVSDDEALARNLQSELYNDSLERNSSLEAICHFNVPNEKLPSTFRLMRVQGIPAWANTSSVSIGDVIQGNVLMAVLSNYMVDVDWLISACPTLKKVPHVLVIHGESDGSLERMKRSKLTNWILHKPPLPISYGTHHSKAMLLVYPRGVRVIVHTANLIYVDWNNKSQGLWMQDFPWKDQNSSTKGCAFESDLIDYLSALKLPECTANLPALGNFNINAMFFKKFDYSSASVRLIASVPGYHTGPSLKKWGHMKLRTILQESIFDKKFHKSPLVYQFSSLGSLDEKWMSELATSMSSGVSEDKVPLGLGEPLIIWPTVDDVRCSLEGYAAGSAIPSPLKNVEKGFLKKYWAKWKASHTGRCCAMPHIKTYTRYNGQNLAWLLLTSSNLSKAAWGVLQKNNSQLMIRSYELGVLFTPSLMKHGCGFSCTDEGNSSEIKCSRPSESSEVKRTKLVTLAWQGSKTTDSSEVIPLPVPYKLPPEPYSPEDVPWSWDRQYNKKDVYGQVWPRQVQMYTSQDS
ncbi:Tyrosyl-DNA phosphodiesterase [Actinidia chinensis var. chinensis]|uniref:Tyrosyl-DNA phosphodiesterase n=1 Tax=Actinidia chinensis var. chinensis TaxID=1590841 RepID=A0A2R6QA02_ACTCC|nr:Tyrosyl-DNA phosphodiesterase [Actinidia chinensis var. chinensis]